MHLNFDQQLHGDGLEQRDDYGNLRDAGRADGHGDSVSGDDYDRAGAVGSGLRGGVARRRDADRVDRSHQRKLHLGSDGSEQWRGDDQYSCGNSTRGHRFAQGDVHAGYGELHCIRNVVRHRLGEGEPSRRTGGDGNAVPGNDYDGADIVGNDCGGCARGWRDADWVGRFDKRELHLGGGDAERRVGDDQCSGGDSAHRNRFAEGDLHT